ncbi:uncharacterized protein TNCV_355241 [Trichonephila clavipes]|uniref:Uncharacterized protein n=1 Tax=Trichonephila clavipes TaxID=2585209 RepID=A0A8X7BC24_TRICX|nr:uncharacterized protein TNCV_355241 [Trichonephila clavipes]
MEDTNKETIRIILQEDLGKTKVCAKFDPITSTPEKKAMRIVHCRDIIPAAKNDPMHQEDFGKRNMTCKRARRHFSQLNEFERGMIIKMKTAGWSTHRVSGQVDRSECVVRNCWEQWTREGTHMRKTVSGATRKTTRREDRRIVRQALMDPTVTRSTIRADVSFQFPDTLQKQILNPSALSVHSF